LKFLGRARRFLKELASEPESRVQYFNVTCGSGHRVRGERTEGYQALRCPACGDGVFVLPRSPLPEPATPARPAGRGARRGRGPVDEGPVDLTDPGRAALDVGDADSGPADAEIIWDDAPAKNSRPTGRDSNRQQQPGGGAATDEESEPFWEEDLNRAAAASPRDTSARRRKPPEPAAIAGSDARPLKQRRQAAAQGTRPGKRPKAPAVAAIEIAPARKRPSPLTLVLILVPLLVVSAAIWRYRRGVLQEYPLKAERGRLEGIPALDDGNFDKAFQLLSEARTAVDALGGEVEGADDIRKAAAQAAVFVDQSPRLLEDMLDEAGHTDGTVWESKFGTLYKGRAIVIDSIIRDEPEPGPSSRFMLEYIVLPPGGATNFVEGKDARPDRYALIDLQGFKLFEDAPPHKGDHVTFGARLAAFEPDPSREFWWVRLEPKSGVFITHTKALQYLGFPGAGAADVPPEIPP
jgi:DNA-directed RNA polymerase subunit RPC12/RpoP